MKLNIEDILVKGVKLQTKKIDFNDASVIELMERCKIAQEECRKRKKVDSKFLELEVTI
jgi:hypothetical protein